jgi:hypothetical protein
LRRELATVESQLAADDDAWERLDRISSPQGFTEQQKIAARRGGLEERRNALRRQVDSSEKGRAALIALVEIVDAMDQLIANASEQLYADVLVVSKQERIDRLRALDGLVRLRARIAAPVAAATPASRFRRGPDPIRALANDLRARVDDIDRVLGPGMPRPTMPLPPGAQELIAALHEGRSL